MSRSREIQRKFITRVEVEIVNVKVTRAVKFKVVHCKCQVEIVIVKVTRYVKFNVNLYKCQGLYC